MSSLHRFQVGIDGVMMTTAHGSGKPSLAIGVLADLGGQLLPKLKHRRFVVAGTKAMFSASRWWNGVSFRPGQGRKMPTDPIPFPLRPAAPPASVVPSRLTFRIGSKRYAIDMEFRVSELKPFPAEVVPIARRSTKAGVSFRSL